MSRPSALPKLIVIVGPTASGKTDLALSLAKRFKGEIISADSRQMYRGTEIGSDTPVGKWKRGKDEKRRTFFVRGVPHYLMGFLSPKRTFTAAQFKDHAIRISRDIRERGHVPILVGGTGLYISSIVDNLSIPQVPPDPAFRKRMERLSTARLRAMLVKKDPAYAKRIPKENRRYMIRALEVATKTGKAFSELQSKGEPLFDVLILGVRRPRPELYARIDRRVDAMMRRGLLAEAKKLGRRHGWDLPAMSGLGHRQLGLSLEGRITLEEAVRLIKRDTRRYAKRQMTWLRREKRVRWVVGKAEANRVVRSFLKTAKVEKSG